MNFDKRIVIDTGTLVSASFRFGSIPSQAYSKALREFAVCVSEETLVELEKVLRRDKFDRYISLEDRLAFLELYRKSAMLYPVTETVLDCRDPKDDKFLALALSAKAEMIISSDEDLCVLNPYRGIAILKPAAFLNR